MPDYFPEGNTPQPDDPPKRSLQKAVSLLKAISEGTGGSGLPEAPADGTQYARKDGAWAEVAVTAAKISDATTAGRSMLTAANAAAQAALLSGNLASLSSGQARNNRCIVIGNSIIANGGRPTSASQSCTGVQWWADAYLGGNLDIVEVFGYSGKTPAEIYTFLTTAWTAGTTPAVLPGYADVGWAIVYPGFNGLTAGNVTATGDSTIAILNALKAVGIKLVVINGYPAESSTTVQECLTIMDRMSAWCYQNGAIYVDAWSLLADSADSFNPKTSWTKDGIHFDTPSAQVVGKAVADAMAPFVMKQNPFSAAGSSTYTGNLCPNGLMLGDSGGLATGWEKSAAFTATKVARTDNIVGEWQRLVGNTAGAYLRHSTFTPSPVLVAGDKYRMTVEVKVNAAPSTATAISCDLSTVNVTGTAKGLWSISSDTAGVIPMTGQTLIIRSAILTIPSGATNMRPFVWVDSDTAGDWDIQVGRVSIVKIS